jgi:hypothetical protein
VGSIPIARSISLVNVALTVFGESEDVFEIPFKKSCDPKSKFEGRRILLLLDGIDRLPTRANFVREFLLRRPAF